MRVIVTGASGFLGRFITNGLAKTGASFLRVSRQHAPGFLRINSYADTPSGDVLIHLAENNNRAQVNKLSAEYEREIACTLRVLLGKGYKKVVYASSSVVYGDNVCTPRIESETVSDIDTYTRVKVESEQRVLSSGGVVARLANIYGPEMPKKNVLSQILDQLKQDGPIQLQDTSHVRDFIWVEDVAEAFVKLVTQKVEGLFNIGTGIGTSIGELAKMVLEEASQPSRKIVSEKIATRHSCIALNITKIKQNLQWQPTTSLREGLRRIVYDYRH